MKWKVLLAFVALVAMQPTSALAAQEHQTSTDSAEVSIGPMEIWLFSLMGFAGVALTAVGTAACAVEGYCCCNKCSPAYENV